MGESRSSAFARIAHKVGVCHCTDSGCYPGDESDVIAAVVELLRFRSDADEARIPIARVYWHEDDGSALWWRFPVSEPPYVGTPLDDDFPEYVTHWTRIVVPFEPFDDANGKEAQP